MAEIIFTILIGSMFILLLGVALKYPKSVLVEIPLGIIKLPWLIIKGSFPFAVVTTAYELISGNSALDGKYKTTRKKFLNFREAKKMILTWETNQQRLLDKVEEGLALMNETLTTKEFSLMEIHNKTMIQPPISISFHSFHFLVQFLNSEKTKSIGIVETTRTTYTVYNDPESENLIGQTDKGLKFYISLMEDHERLQFLRISEGIVALDEFDVRKVKNELKN